MGGLKFISGVLKNYFESWWVISPPLGAGKFIKAKSKATYLPITNRRIWTAE